MTYFQNNFTVVLVAENMQLRVNNN